jgi:hypothetical protein
MPKPIDLIPEMTPQRTAVRVEVEGGGWIVCITPPAMMGPMPTVSVHLTDDQYRRYQEWRKGGELIQTLFPELSANDREKLMTGLDDDDFHEAAKE